MTASSPSVAPASAPTRTPSVLAILVVRAAEPALRPCLHALASQTYEQFGVLAVDDATDDDTNELLERALGASRVIRNDERLGYARSFAVALQQPAVAAADHVLLLHGDAVLDEDAVACLVEATTVQADAPGIVGAKVVDLDHPRELRDVGRAVDRFGHAISPLQPGEIDQGQFDRILDVLAVDGCAMLIDRAVWQRIGLYDERLGTDDVDLCWRARVAGWPVLMTPRARVQHGPAHDDVDPDDDAPSPRYVQDRNALTSVLKNYSAPSLLWVLPLGALLTIIRLLFLCLGRRFEEAYELLAAIGWNITHAGGTLRRRRETQRARSVRDHALSRYTASAGLHLPRWFQTAERILEEQREFGEGDAGRPAAQRLRHRTASFVSEHPVVVGAFVGGIVWGFAARALVSPNPLVGAALPSFPQTPGGFFAELVSGYRTTGLGGTDAASPGLAALGGISYLSLVNTTLAQKLIVIVGPVLATVLCYRAVVRRTGKPGAAVVAAATYASSALMLWSISEGRVAQLFLMAVMPPLVERMASAFARAEPSDGRLRFAAGLAVTFAVGAAFVPGVALAVGLLALAGIVLAPGRIRGVALVAAATVAAAILLFPFLPTMTGDGGLGFWSGIGQLDPWRLLRFSLGHAPGDWSPALVLPIGALLGLALARGDRRAPAARAAIVGVVALGLAWLGTAGYLPVWASNAPVFTTLAAVCAAFVLGDGLASAFGGLERTSFGFRQIGSVLLTAVLAIGLFLQALAAMAATWGVGGPDRVPPSWAVLSSATEGAPYNVVWLADRDGQPFPAPGGDPAGVVPAGAATAAYTLTDRTGSLGVDIGRPLTGAGVLPLESTLHEILSGTTVHGGALLAPFGVRFLVVPEDRLNAAAEQAVRAQVDLEPVPSAGLSIWRNTVAMPPAAVLKADDETRSIARTDDPDAIQRLRPAVTGTLAATEGGWLGPSGSGDLAAVASAYDPSWELVGRDAPPDRSFGWATSFSGASGDVQIRFGDQFPRTLAMWLLAAVWAVALWVTRKPVRR
jgi:GT2 family glycosyltransferase